MDAGLAETTAGETGSAVICLSPLGPVGLPASPISRPSSWPKDKGAQGCSLWRAQPPG